MVKLVHRLGHTIKKKASIYIAPTAFLKQLISFLIFLVKKAIKKTICTLVQSA